MLPSFDHLSISIYLLCSHMGKAKGGDEGVSFPQVPVIVAGRSEHPFISICDLHDQLLLNVEEVKIVIFAS